MSDTAARTSYDDVPYDSFAYPQSHPSRLATMEVPSSTGLTKGRRGARP